MPVGDPVMCKMSVLYIGTSVPLETSEGLDAIQQPLKEHYPADDGATVAGMASTLTVLPTGLQLLLKDDESGTILWFPITSLTLCAAVRCINTINTASGEKVQKFVSLSSPAAGGPNAKRPAIFTAITRRTKGKKVLECHGFICESARDALELVKKTSMADMMSKGKVNGTVLNNRISNYGVDHSSQIQSQIPNLTPRLDESHTPRKTSLTHDFPVRLLPGEGQPHMNGVAPEFMENPPEHGYFYSTKTTKVKKYSVDPVSDAEVEYHHTTSPPPPLVSRGAGDRRSVYSQPPGPAMQPGASLTLPHPRGAHLIPVRTVGHPPPPTLISPPPPTVISPPHVVNRRRFFSPPPAQVIRPRVIPGAHRQDPHVFMPPQPIFVEAPVVRRRLPRRGSHSSRSGSSSRSSSPRNLHDETYPKRHDNGDLSSELSSRPRTPPTDYDIRHQGPRISRREEYDIGHRPHHSVFPVNGFHPPPQNYYIVGPQRLTYLPRYADRARSVPPPDDHKGKKGKNKKKDKKGKKRIYGVPSDSPESVNGYMSENPNVLDRSYPRLPKDFRKRENMNMSERAFSKNLEAQSRASVLEPGRSAYALNEHMAARYKDDEFNMY